MKLDEEIIKICLKIAKRGEGALIIVGEANYKTMIDQTVPSFDITKNPKLLESLALIDGAVIVDKEGMMKAYGAKIKSDRIFLNFGTRHAAGYNASYNKDTTAYLVSEEEEKVKVFRDGKLIMQIDPKEKDIEKKTPEINNLLEGIGFGTASSVGMGILTTSLGVAGVSFFPGVIVFGGAYYLLKKYGKSNDFQ
jgi:hypothetical protein